MGSMKTNKDTDLEKVIKSNNLCVLKNKFPTYLNRSTGSYSAIDITLSDPSSYMDNTWKVHDDPCGSEHFLIKLEILLPIHDNNQPSLLENKIGNNFKPYAIKGWFKPQIAQF